MRAGATDKVVYEAAADCLPVLASNPALDGFLPEELRFERDDPAGLAARIRALAAADRAALGHELRARVERDHSVEGWAAGSVEVASTVTRPVLHVGKVSGSPAPRSTFSCCSRSSASAAGTCASRSCTRASRGPGSSPAPARGRRCPRRGVRLPLAADPDRVSRASLRLSAGSGR